MQLRSPQKLLIETQKLLPAAPLLVPAPPVPPLPGTQMASATGRVQSTTWSTALSP